MSDFFYEGSEKYIEYGNEKLSEEFLRKRIDELTAFLRSDESCDLLVTKQNLELNKILYKDCFC